MSKFIPAIANVFAAVTLNRTLWIIFLFVVAVAEDKGGFILS